MRFLVSILLCCLATLPLRSQTLHWLDTFKTAEVADRCGQSVLSYLKTLRSERGHRLYTFDKYRVNERNITPAHLNTKSLHSAHMFRTRISEGLADSGINFAGHYTIVTVPMTGWHDNYWIVDRTNGQAYEFPYKAISLSFEKNSNLLIMDPREDVYNSLRQMSEFGFACVGIVRNYNRDIKYIDLVPTYFLWKDNKLILLSPKNRRPPKNEFFECW